VKSAGTEDYTFCYSLTCFYLVVFNFVIVADQNRQ